MSRRVMMILPGLVLLALLAGCGGGKQVTRVDPTEQIDLSGQWNDVDSRQVAEELVAQITAANWVDEFRDRTGRKPILILGEPRNKWDTLRAGYFQEEVREAAIAHAYLRPEMTVADVGSGTGFMAAGLAPLVSHVYVLDGSAAMLDVARGNLAGCTNVSVPANRRPHPPAARRQRGCGLRQYVSPPLSRSGRGAAGDGARVEARRPAGHHRHGRSHACVDARGDGRRVAGLRPRPDQGLAARSRSRQRAGGLHEPMLRELADRTG